MLKKAGIVVATAAAGLLAVSPLAFAGDKGDHDGHGKGHGHHGSSKVEDVNSIDGSNEGLINVAGNNIAVPVNVCDNQVPVNVLGVQVPLNDTNVLADLTGALGQQRVGVEGGGGRHAGANRTTAGGIPGQNRMSQIATWWQIAASTVAAWKNSWKPNVAGHGLGLRVA